MSTSPGLSAEHEFACRDGDVVAYWQAVVEPRLTELERPPSEKEKLRLLKSLVRLRSGFLAASDPVQRDLHGTRGIDYPAQELDDCDQRFLVELGVSDVA